MAEASECARRYGDHNISMVLRASSPVASGLPDPIIFAALRDAQRRLDAQGMKEGAIDAILNQWRKLDEAQQMLEQKRGKVDPAERQAIRDHIEKERQAIEQSARIEAYGQKAGLIIETAPNTFRLTFPVLMFKVPTVSPRDVPDGIAVSIIEVSKVGCTLIYAPMTHRVLIGQVHAIFDAGL